MKEDAGIEKNAWFYKLFKDDIFVYAHCAEGRETETLQEHTSLCLTYFYRLLQTKRLKECLENMLQVFGDDDSPIMKDIMLHLAEEAVRFHDTGKSNPVFQKKRMERPYKDVAEFPCLREANHSLLSAYIYLDYFCNYVEGMADLKKNQKRKLKALIFVHAYVISRHHGDLGRMNDFCDQCNENGDLYQIAEYFKNNRQAIYRGPFFFTERSTELLIVSWNNYKKGKGRKEQITLYFYTRLLYSLLVSCDYYATTEYMTGYKILNFGENNQKNELIHIFENSKLTRKIREYEKSLKENTERDVQYPEGDDSLEKLNNLRSELFLEAEKVWSRNKQKNLFFLEAPTGGGKSNIAFNLSFHMLQEGAEKLCYNYPFNTLVEQNKASMEKIFGQDESVFSKVAVVNSMTPIMSKSKELEAEKECENNSFYYQKALLDRQFLNYPIVISTHVTLFQTLFGAKQEALFGFLQMAHSVIVLDEIQSYRNEIWSEIICFLQVFAEMMDSRVIIMSATLPNLEYLTGQSGQVIRLVEDREKYFCNPLFQKRVEISYELLDEKMTAERLTEHIFQHIKGNQKVLIEFIKKDSAYGFYRYLCDNVETSLEIRLLTGDDNQVEREKILKEIGENKSHGIILISTQVIEAGVDIDMDVGYKDISKLDSEEQFMGRINRSYKDPNIRGKVYFFNMDQGNVIYRQDIRISKEFTLENKAMRQILQNKNFDEYYGPVMRALKEQRNDQTNAEGLEIFFDNCVGEGDFIAVEERMRLIQDDQWHISVFLCRDIELAEGHILRGEDCWNEYKMLLQNQTMDYAEKQVKLSQVRSKMNYFIYQVKRDSNLIYNDSVGELLKIDNGEEFFENGKLNRKKLEEAGGLFIEF